MSEVWYCPQCGIHTPQADCVTCTLVVAMQERVGWLEANLAGEILSHKSSEKHNDELLERIAELVSELAQAREALSHLGE